MKSKHRGIFLIPLRLHSAYYYYYNYYKKHFDVLIWNLTHNSLTCNLASGDVLCFLWSPLILRDASRPSGCVGVLCWRMQTVSLMSHLINAVSLSAVSWHSKSCSTWFHRSSSETNLRIILFFSDKRHISDAPYVHTGTPGLLCFSHSQKSTFSHGLPWLSCHRELRP